MITLEIIASFTAGVAAASLLTWLTLRGRIDRLKANLDRWKRVSRSLVQHHSPTPTHDSDDIHRVESVCSQLVQDEQRLKAVLDAMSEGLALLDSRQHVLLNNPAFYSMFHVKAGRSFSRENLTADGARELDLALKAIRENRKIATLELRLTTTPPRDILTTLTPYTDQELGDAVILTAFDVTARKRIEQMRTEFVANVSHELRTPLAAIRGYAETCMEPGTGGKAPPYERFLPIILQHTLRLNALIEDLLILSRIESRGMQLALAPLQVDKVLEAAIATLIGGAEKKRVALINALPPLLPDVIADASALERILLNLVENGIKYSEEDSEVSITARVQGESLCIMVIDRGVGIPREDQQRIFERFYRVDKARSRKAGGTGLGLSIVKHLVQSHHGEVWVDSEPGRGSTFFFTLPLARRSELQANGAKRA